MAMDETAENDKAADEAGSGAEERVERDLGHDEEPRAQATDTSFSDKGDGSSEEAENSEPAVTEEQLLEIARSEGLLDSSFDQDGDGEGAGGSSDDGDGGDEAASAKATKLDPEQEKLIMASIETVLFMSDKPVSLPRLRATINPEVPLSAYRALMNRLREEFAADHRGVEIADVALGFQLRTKPQMAAVLRKMVKTQPLKLSPATMEVLAVVAYKQPVTKDEVDRIRGVDSGYVLRNLMEKRLVKIAGRSDLPGRPMIYGTTHEFLELFNLKDAQQLPPLHEIEAMVAASEVGFEEKKQHVEDEFGKLVDATTTVLFDDSKIDDELESLRAEIASIPTSTPFIEEQKAQEKRAARLAVLLPLGLTLDENGNEISIAEHEARQAAAQAQQDEAQAQVQARLLAEAAVIATEEAALAAALDTEIIEETTEPSAELELEAAEAQLARHTEMLAEAIGEVQFATLQPESQEPPATALEPAPQDSAPKPEQAQKPSEEPEQSL